VIEEPDLREAFDIIDRGLTVVDRAVEGRGGVPAGAPASRDPFW
jgi:hypothetical protein